MTFKEIVGQERVKERLIKSVESGKIAHAQMFEGPAGAGKLALAIAYAQFISCTNRLPNDSCNECPSCLKINKLAHPDLHFSFPVCNMVHSLLPTSLCLAVQVCLSVCLPICPVSSLRFSFT